MTDINFGTSYNVHLVSHDTVEPLYNEVLGTLKITLLYQVSHNQGKKTKKYKELGPAKLIRPRYNEVPLYTRIWILLKSLT